ncbi:TetR/AcrR family transcriptional regulator [Mycolicibacterium sp. HK-90]|uniref:TetR/AcrR family transcriptional regulator n=1 Tax=Mycobacteriaceae TaxID=1762 RepID=UPI002658FCFF|nr:TetR/AcrR family transcriptional regulator [Mycolicibacterium sp. HK-90]WKG06831.1 TetR/AcrR family transcriptional regulator [Mycolicibacterium sp. HK-90]
MATQRKRDGQKRRRELCDAAVQVLAEQGSHGLSHPKVDQQAGVPSGTTSYYYRTRAALLRGVAERVAEMDTANLQSVTEESTKSDSPFGRIAHLVMMQGDGAGLMLNKARQELLLASTRDPALAEVYQDFLPHIITMCRDAIEQILPPEPASNPELLDMQSTAVTTFIGGVYGRLLVGDQTIANAEQLERFLTAIVRAVSAEYSATAGKRKSKRHSR